MIVQPGAGSTARADEESRHVLDRPLGGGQPDAHERPARERIEPFERQGEMRAPLAAHEEMVRELHGLGVGLAIDDFGTGYSSLSYLQQYPVQLLKIDKSFTSRIGQDRGAEAIIRVIVGLARTLSLRTLAEGVETPEQAAFLREAGCDAGQGYLYSRPVEEAALLAFIRQMRTP